MLKSLILKHFLLSYVIINYLFSWIFLYPCYQIILNNEEGGIPPIAFIGILGAYGPTIIAIYFEWIQNGKSGVKNLLNKILIWKVHFGWYLFILIIPSLLYAFSVLSTSLWGFEVGTPDIKEGLSLTFLYIMLALPFGPMGEELGWRGFMLPRLLQKYNLWQSSLILGFVWTFWHIASFTFPGAAIPSVFEVGAWTIFLYLLNITAETLLFTFIFFKTRGSVLIAILFHATYNACSNIVLAMFPLVEENVAQREALFITNILLMAVLAIVLLMLFKPNKSEE